NSTNPGDRPARTTGVKTTSGGPTRKLIVLSALVVVVAVACGDDSGSSNASTGTSTPVRLAGKVNVHGQKDLGGAATLEIEQDDFYFSPTFVKASAGQTIKVEL